VLRALLCAGKKGGEMGARERPELSSILFPGGKGEKGNHTSTIIYKKKKKGGVKEKRGKSGKTAHAL